MTILAEPQPIPIDWSDAYRFRVEEYLELCRSGILSEPDRVELLEGVVTTKTGKNPPHVLAVKRLVRLLTALLPAGWHVAKEDPVVTTTSVPEPDGAILRGSPEDYADRLPSAADVPLVVEVSDTSLARDRAWKRRIYADAGIACYWIVDLANRRLIRHAGPVTGDSGADYRLVEEFGPDAEVPVVLDGREVGRVRVSEILP